MAGKNRQVGEQGIGMGKKAVICYLLIVSCLLSCKTAPHTALSEDSRFVPLEPGAFAYIFVDVQNAGPIIEQLQLNPDNNRQFRQMVERTQSAAAAVYMPGNERVYQLAAWGKYPASRAKMALGMNKNWKKQKSAHTGSGYWYSAKDRYSVALNAGQVFVSSYWGTTPLDPFPSGQGTEIPDKFSAFSRGAPLSFWLENPGVIINQLLSNMGIPLELPAEQFFAAVYPDNESAGDSEEQLYTATMRIKVAGATQARALVTIIGIARGFFLLGSNASGQNNTAMLASLLFANPPVQDDDSLIIKTNTIRAGDIALLFRLFSI